MNTLTKSILKEIAIIIPCAIVFFFPPPAGLSPLAMKFIALFLWTILNWSIPIIPTFVVGLLFLTFSALFKVVSFKVAFSPFSSSTVWLIISVLALGSAVSKTGLLTRLSFVVMNIFPPSFKGQIAALLGAGLLIGPFMPSTTAKVSIAGGFSTKIAEMLGFTPHSKGMNGMCVAMYTGFSLLAPAFMTSSFYSYLILGAIPAQDSAYFTFASWFMAMIPWCIFTVFGSYLALLLLYTPKEKTSLTKEDIKKLSKDLGPMTVPEKKTLLILLLCLLSWSLEKVIVIPSVLPALLGMSALFITKVLAPNEINTKVNWGIIIFASSIIAMAPMVQAVGINTWIATNLNTIMSSVGHNPYIFVTAVSILVLLSRFVLVSGTTAISLMVVLLAPFCQAAGMNGWIGGIIAYAMAQPFFFKYQNPNFLVGFEAAGGDEKVNYSATIPYCAIFHIIAIIGLLLSIPYWQVLGLIN